MFRECKNSCGVSGVLELFPCLLSLLTTYCCKSCGFVLNKVAFQTYMSSIMTLSCRLVSKAAGQQHHPPAIIGSIEKPHKTPLKDGRFRGWSFPLYYIYYS